MDESTVMKIVLRASEIETLTSTLHKANPYTWLPGNKNRTKIFSNYFWLQKPHQNI